MKVSVCMATYNGMRYVEEQIKSILPQLSVSDELVIVDDASEDETVARVLSFHDARIHLLRNERNQGVIKAFERALLQASGDLVFLSDQDDIWRPDKVEKFKEFFAARPRMTVALSDARVIDQDGRETSPSWMGRAGFSPNLIKNLVRNRYLGCVMVFRGDVLKFCLPFPPRIPMHDMWIGLMNQIFGEAGCLRETLVSYRRHGLNTTRGRHAAIGQMIIWRWNLATSLLVRAITTKMKMRTD